MGNKQNKSDDITEKSQNKNKASAWLGFCRNIIPSVPYRKYDRPHDEWPYYQRFYCQRSCYQRFY